MGINLKTIFRIIFGTFCVLPTLAFSSTELRRFSNCYTRLTGGRVPVNHPLVSLVRSGQMSSVTACMEIFDKARLTSTGLAQGETGSTLDRQEARQVLANFHNFHRTWFPSDIFMNALTLEANTGESDILDPAAAANDVSRILFSGSNYQELLTGYRSVQAIRESTPTLGPTTKKPASAFIHDYYNSGGPQTFSPTFLQLGALRGFRSLNSSELGVTINAAFGENSAYTEAVELPYQMPRGGGAMGTPSYLLLNMHWGRKDNGRLPRADGGRVVARRWSEAVLNDFLCRDLGTLRGSDTVPYIRTSSTLPFRPQPSCMNCHATIDSMAGVIRNFGVYGSVTFNVPVGKVESFFIGEAPASIPAGGRVRKADQNYLAPESDIFGSDHDDFFYMRPPNGRLVMRDYKGELIDTAVTGLEELGQELVKTDDMYVCAAKRYFEFLTGHQVSMLEEHVATSTESRDRDFVVQAAMALKENQINLRGLIQSILKSRQYQESLQ